ncbi:MAG: LamG-like jellyroll fold domain-containing protein, partial [Candidatus Nanohaloarchaea archaeon]
MGFSSAASFTVSSQSDWNKGTFNGTSADRKDNSGVLGIGYLNGSNSGQPNQDGLNNGSLVGYWRMDASSDPLPGSFNVADYSGEGNNGTSTGFEGDERGSQGVFGTNSFDFDGNDDAVDTSSTYFHTSTWTESAWFKMPTDASSKRHAILGTYDGSFPQVKLLVNDVDFDYAGSLRVADDSNSFRLSTSKSLNDGNWHHLAASRNGDKFKLYLDGKEVDSTTDSSFADDLSSGNVRIGARPDGNEYFYGKIESARIYNRTLSSNEIKELYFNTSADKFFEGEYIGQKIDNSQKRNWEKLNVNLSNLPSGTDVDANFSALDTNGDIVDSEIIDLSQGDNNYTLSVSDSEDARVSFNGTSTNESQSWEIDSYTVYHQAGNRADYVHTFREGKDTPRSFFGNGSTVTIRTAGSFSSTPTVTVTDSTGVTRISSATMTNISGTFEYNYTLDGANGWYNVDINGNTWEHQFYQSPLWQGNYTDADGNKFSFRRKINVTEPNVSDRFFEPVDRNVDFAFSPDNDSIRVVAWNGSRMLEIPSQTYNVTKSGETVSNANVVFLSSLNQSETRTYYIMSAKAEFQKSYAGVTLQNGTTEDTFTNSYYQAMFNSSMGGLMRDVKDRIGLNSSLSGSEPMDFYPAFDIGLSTTHEARSDSTATVSLTNGSLLTKVEVSGHLDGISDYPYTVDCTMYAKNTYMKCEKNLTTKKSEDWKNFKFNGLVFEDGSFSWTSFRNSTGDVKVSSMGSGDNSDSIGLDSNMSWVTFYDNTTGDGVAELFLDREFDATNNPEIKIKDDSGNDFYQQMLIDSSETSVSSGDYWYTETARMIYNGLREWQVVNDTYRQLENPVTVLEGEESTNDKQPANYTNTGNVSTNDTSSVKFHSYWVDDTFLDYAEINITGNGVNGSNTELYYNDSYDIRDAGGFTNESWVNVTLDSSTVNAGLISANITVFDVAGKSNSTLIEFNVSDATAPEYSSVVNSPNSSAELDPNHKVNITANITEYSNVSTAFLYYKNDSVANYSKTEMTRNGETDFIHTYDANFTPEFEDNYTYYVSANDTLDQRRNSSKTNITVVWDYTWNFDPSLSGSTATFNTNVSIGNFTINNTGDFNQTFKLSTGVFNSRTWVNSTKLPANFEVGNGSSKLFTVNATTRDSTSTEGLDTFNLTVENTSASPQLNFSSFDVTTSTGGPFLHTEITEYNSTVTQGDTGVKLTAETTNKGNETANTVNITFNLPSDWSASSGESLTSGNTISLDVGTTKSFTTKVDIASDAATGTKTIEAVAKSQEDNRSTTVDVTVESKSSGGGNNDNSGSGGGGGGGSGGAGGSGAGAPGLTSEQQRKLFQTEQTYDIVRGEDQKFTLTVENPFQEGELENVKVKVSGFLSQYLSVEPNSINEIGVNQSKNFSINIEAPKYFSRGEYSLNFNITGINNKSQTYTTGNDTYLAKDIQKFKENREVQLIVHEISKQKASKALNQSREAVKDLKKQEVMNTETKELLSEAKRALKSGNYQKARQISQQIQKKRQKAENARETIHKDKKLIDKAEYRGLKAPKTERMVSMASAALERGDYSMAASRAEEAKNLYALETKGEINYVNFAKRNWKKLGIGFIMLIGISTGVFLRFRLFRIKRKLSKLEEEEETLLGLMKQVQRESFEEGKMSMEEYEEAMMQYEKQLSQNVKDTVR